MDILNDKDIKILKYSNDPISFMEDILNLEVKHFHKEWVELFENNDFVSLLAPRGHGKSTIVSGYVLWNIIRNPSIRILQVTINQDKASEMMSVIQQNLLANDKLKELWGEQKNPSDWSKGSIRVINRGSTGRAAMQPTFTVTGVSASMIGGHYDIIILDDVTDAKNSKTEYRRSDLVNWYNQTLLPMRDDEGDLKTKFISIGTKWHENDIHAYFRKLKQYKCRTYKAIIYEPNEEELKKGNKPQVLWPEKYDYDALMDIKSQAGSAGFSMQYQNEVVSPEDAVIKWEWIDRAMKGFIGLEPPFEIYMGVDLASKGEETDFFSISIVAIKDGIVYLMDGYRGDLMMNEQFQKIKEYDYRWNPIRIGIDSAAQQKMVTEQLEADNPLLPIVPIKPSIVNDRMSRVQRLSVLFETNRIFMKPDLGTYADELSMFPRGTHDDTIDSLSFALQAGRFEDDIKHVDWNRVDNLIYKSNKGTNVAMPKRRSYDVYIV